MDAPATIICRLNIENWSTNNQEGLNISIFDATTSLEQTNPNPTPSAPNDPTNPSNLGEGNNQQPPLPQENNTNNNSTTIDTTPSPRYSFSGKMLSTCSPTNAFLSSNNGVYVIRPSGASIQPSELPAGRYLLVPSTFEPREKKYNLDVYVLSSLGQGAIGFNILKLR